VDKPIGIIDFFGEMLAKREYLIPLVAAQYQFPNHYHQMTAAALIEDLFVDAAINFKNEAHRGIELIRPEKTTKNKEIVDAKGEKGWDYRYEGQNYSHKVGKNIQDIALLWDATYELPVDQTYSYPSPMVFVLSNYQSKRYAYLNLNEKDKVQILSLTSFRNRTLNLTQSIIIVKKQQGQLWKVMEHIEVTEEHKFISDFLPLDKLWAKMMDFWTSGSEANELEIFVIEKNKSQGSLVIESGQTVSIDFSALPGIYIFPFESLQKVKVKKNNRAILLPTKTVTELVEKSFTSGQFVLCPNWYTYYADARSVDLYQVQRSEYDKLNTAARK
jgi:hypothetical protein